MASFALSALAPMFTSLRLLRFFDFENFLFSLFVPLVCKKLASWSNQFSRYPVSEIFSVKNRKIRQLQSSLAQVFMDKTVRIKKLFHQNARQNTLDWLVVAALMIGGAFCGHIVFYLLQPVGWCSSSLYEVSWRWKVHSNGLVRIALFHISCCISGSVETRTRLFSVVKIGPSNQNDFCNWRLNWGCCLHWLCFSGWPGLLVFGCLLSLVAVLTED